MAAHTDTNPSVRWATLPSFERPAPARSRNMAAMRGRNTKPELLVRRALHASGFRFRVHRKDIPGRPDIVLPRYHRVVFVHGCFWHGHGCPRAPIPKTNRDYWIAKRIMNAERDARDARLLEERGWKVTTIWQCQLDQGIEQLIRLLRSERADSAG